MLQVIQRLPQHYQWGQEVASPHSHSTYSSSNGSAGPMQVVSFEVGNMFCGKVQSKVEPVYWNDKIMILSS